MRNGQLVGIVSRANLIEAVASARKGLEIPLSDTTIRDKLLARLKEQPWAHLLLLNVTVNGGVVDLLGYDEIGRGEEGHSGSCRIHPRCPPSTTIWSRVQCKVGNDIRGPPRTAIMIASCRRERMVPARGFSALAEGRDARRRSRRG